MRYASFRAGWNGVRIEKDIGEWQRLPLVAWSRMSLGCSGR